MNRNTSFSLVAEHAPAQAGMLWNTTNSAGCDTAQAVSDQYSDNELQEAVRDLDILAGGSVPAGWEPFDQEKKR